MYSTVVISARSHAMCSRSHKDENCSLQLITPMKSLLIDKKLQELINAKLIAQKDCS